MRAVSGLGARQGMGQVKEDFVKKTTVHFIT
jgi:hypothetical protein